MDLRQLPCGGKLSYHNSGCGDSASVDGSAGRNFSIPDDETNVASGENDHRDCAGNPSRCRFVKTSGLYKEDGRKNRDEIAYLAQTFDEMLEELEKVFQREKQFTSDVSHELRTPVSVILAQCESCLEEESFNEKQREQIMVIQKKARTIAELISHLLMLSRADQGRLKLHLEEVNVSELVEMIAEEQQISQQNVISRFRRRSNRNYMQSWMRHFISE